MKRLLLLLNIIMGIGISKAVAYDFASVNNDGVTIYYNYISQGEELEVTYQTRNSANYKDVIYRIPSLVMIDGKNLPVTRIGEFAFDGSSVAVLEIPESIISLGESAFQSCSQLTAVTIPNSVEGALPQRCFSNCEKLKSIQLSDNITEIGPSVFYNCAKLEKVILPDNVASIEDYAFCGCISLHTISFGSKITTLSGYHTWDNCISLKKVIIRDLFAWCAINIIQVGGSDSPVKRAKHIYSDENAEIKNLVIPDGVTNISEEAFQGCEGIESLTIPNSVQNIGNHAFQGNNHLKKLILGEALNNIGTAGFSGCPLDTIICYSKTPPTIAGYGTFANGYNATVFVPVGKVNTYKSANWWKNFKAFLELPTVTLDKHSITMNVGDENQMVATIYPSSDKPLIWESSNEEIVTVDENGLIKAKKSGTACVHVTLRTFVDAIDKCELTVLQPATGIILSEASLTLTQLGEMKQLVAKVLPEDASNKTVKWTNSNTAVCTVSENGTVVAVGYGTATIVATTVDGGFPASCVITVSNPVTLTANSYVREYGDSNPIFEFTSEGGTLNGIPQITCEATESSPVGVYPIVISKGSVTNPNATFVNGTLTITKAQLLIKAGNYVKKQGEENPTFTASYQGFKNNETEEVLIKKPVFNTDVTTSTVPGEYSVTVSGAEATNYGISYQDGTIIVTDADAVVIKADDKTILYGEAVPELTYSVNGAELVGTPEITCDATSSSPVGTYPIIVRKGSVSNYNDTYINGTLTINKRELTVSTNSYTRAYGEENPEFELFYQGFVNNEDVSVLVAKPKATTVAGIYADAGTYDIIIANGIATNYDFRYNKGTLTIEKAYQTLTWEQDLSGVKQYDQVELLAEASSKLPVTYSVEGSQICAIIQIGNKQYLDCTGTGEAVIVAVQEGNGNYWQTTKIYKPITIVAVSGVTSATTDIDGDVKMFDITGSRINHLRRGINIIRMSDGTTKKVIVK